MATNKNGAAVTKPDTELDKLYKNYDILVNAKDKIAEVFYKALWAWVMHAFRWPTRAEYKGAH